MGGTRSTSPSIDWHLSCFVYFRDVSSSNVRYPPTFSFYVCSFVYLLVFLKVHHYSRYFFYLVLVEHLSLVTPSPGTDVCPNSTLSRDSFTTDSVLNLKSFLDRCDCKLQSYRVRLPCRFGSSLNNLVVLLPSTTKSRHLHPSHRTLPWSCSWSPVYYITSSNPTEESWYISVTLKIDPFSPLD